MPVKECCQIMLHNPLQLEFRKVLFSKIVPNLKKLGLLDAGDGWLRQKFGELGVLEYETWEDTGPSTSACSSTRRSPAAGYEAWPALGRPACGPPPWRPAAGRRAPSSGGSGRASIERWSVRRGPWAGTLAGRLTGPVVARPSAPEELHGGVDETEVLRGPEVVAAAQGNEPGVG